jgi:4-hydroxy-tetrahydrodipicolinate synthase
VFTSSLIALVTPLDGNNRVDYSSLKRLIDFHVEQGSDALVVAGTSGEAATLTRSEEHIRLPLTPFSEQYHEAMRAAMNVAGVVWEENA